MIKIISVAEAGEPTLPAEASHLLGCLPFGRKEVMERDYRHAPL